MANRSFLTNHARVLMCVARDPGARLRDIAAGLGITERSAYGIVAELAETGYVVKQKDGRPNRYQIQAHLPLPEPTSREHTVGEILALLPAPTRRCDLPQGRTKAAASPAYRHHSRAGSSRRDQRRNLAPQAAAAALPSCGPTTKDGQLPADAATRGSTPFQPNIRSSVPDGAGRSTNVIAIAASAPQ
jgi:hypothetical protein